MGGAVVLLLALLYLLPQRADPEQAGPIQARVLELPALQLDEPPGWARQRGVDEVVRLLDRMGWGGHQVIIAARQSLERFAGELGTEILARLAAIGESDPVLASKLVELLGNEDVATPGLVLELVHRAHSRSDLVAKAALRVLSHVNDPRAVQGIVSRLFDPDPDLRAHARGALAERARRGDEVAQGIVLDELAFEASDPDLAFLVVLPDFAPADRTLQVLESIAAQTGGAVRLVAQTALLKMQDPEAEAAFEEMVTSDDAWLRIEALNSAYTSGRVIGESSWDKMFTGGFRDELLALARILSLSIDTGHDSAAHAMNLLEALAADPNSSVASEVTGALFDRRHVWAVEATRLQIQQRIGAGLSLTVDRIINGPAEFFPDFSDLAVQRISESELGDSEQVLLLRLLAHIAPEKSAPLILDFVRHRQDVPKVVMDAVLALLPQLGPGGVQLLSGQLDTDDDRILFIYMAARVGSGAAIPGLREILLAEDVSVGLRIEALDCIARLRDGPREDTLREVLDQLNDPTLRERARLLFWNYL
jgi:HEAT repeat protein